jgi:signal transduction histidine kinase
VRLEAIRIECSHLNAMHIDKSISAFHVAADARSEKQKSLARELAKEAIGRLERELSRGATPPDTFSADAFLTPLINAILSRAPDCKVNITGDRDIKLGYHLAYGLYEATILAINNSLAHAPGATERKVSIKATSNGLKIVVMDNGKGFRMSSVHKTALGVRWVIFKRLEALGVKVKLDTARAKGTTWIFEWQP